MLLILAHPEVAFRNCTDCQQYVYNEQTGQRENFQGRPVERPPGTHPPCRYKNRGCAKGTPEDSRELNLKNLRAYVHYSECRATGRFPDDPIVARNACAIRQVEDAVERQRQLELQLCLLKR